MTMLSQSQCEGIRGGVRVQTPSPTADSNIYLVHVTEGHVTYDILVFVV